MTSRYLHFSRPEILEFLAATATAYAESYLHGRLDAVELVKRANAIFIELQAFDGPGSDANLLRLLLVAMAGAQSGDSPHADRWRLVLGFLTAQVRRQSRERARSAA